nr:type 1 periplasmic binding fold superfamily protein [uncultured Flavobacterium sp.]
MNKNAKRFLGQAFAFLSSVLLGACHADDPIEPVNEVEFITTVRLVFTPENGGKNVVLEFKDLDGEGANAPVITVSSSFEKAKTYSGAITFKNELITPAIDITREIVQEALEHQMFYQTTGSLNPLTYATTQSNFDAKGKPLGLQSVFRTTGAATGILRVTLKHGPNKSAPNVANGSITNAGGATDAQVDFNITVE